MNVDPIAILRRYENDPKLGAVAREALQFIEGSEFRFQQSPGPGQSSHSIVRMYKIRMHLPKFKRDAFIGLEESIKSLSEHEITVHLSVIETEKGVVSVWLADSSGPPLGIVIAKFVTQTG
ncbi:MAG: hypothetical protein WCB10_05170 [Steroidobacteraceae bacterium]